jgi:hypothetical protein
MKESHYIGEEELLKKAIDTLMEKLGPVETSRFLSLSMKRRMESVRRHRIWQAKLDKDKFFKEVFQL